MFAVVAIYSLLEIGRMSNIKAIKLFTEEDVGKEHLVRRRRKKWTL